MGTQSFEIVDDHREEKWVTEKAPRRLMVQMWYPTDGVKDGQKAPYHSHPALYMKDFSKENGIPGFLLQSFVKQETFAWEKAPLLKSNKSFPVLLFSHGYGSNRSQSQFQMNELASHGYIVISIDHTYYSLGTVFPDGSIPGLNDAPFSQEPEIMDPYVIEWSEDAQSVANWVEEVNAGSIADHSWLEQLEGKLDLNRLGYLGHSFGGAAASHTLAVDSRFKVGINMDGFPYGDAYQLGVNQPFLTMISDEELLPLLIDDAQYLDEFYEKIEEISGKDYMISIDGALHMDFTDFPLLSPITSWIGMTGKVAAEEQHAHINETILHFLEQYLINAEH
ncbi:putative hydrolase [Bacillus sp. TS-2]|nr:putative hydrolase [Bacillus sp. TS-2]